MEFEDESHKINVFEALFERDLEKWFSAGIACCDSCVDDFLSLWPLANLWSDTQFSQSYMDLRSFYSGGLTQETFSYQEFLSLVKHIKCPNCCRPLNSGFWPFNMPYHANEDLQDEIEAIASISSSTPFLVLENGLAKNVLNEITALGVSHITEATGPLYRARVREIQRDYNNDDFLAPPRSVTKEGRYNHAGKPVLYLGNEEKTCWHELRKPKEGIVTARIELDCKIKILSLVNMLEMDNSLFQALVWSSLVSSPAEGEGWHKPHFVFTRFISDCARYAGFDAIKYPSVRRDLGTNLVLLEPERFTKNMKISDVRFYQNSDE